MINAQEARDLGAKIFTDFVTLAKSEAKNLELDLKLIDFYVKRAVHLCHRNTTINKDLLSTNMNYLIRVLEENYFYSIDITSNAITLIW